MQPSHIFSHCSEIHLSFLLILALNGIDATTNHQIWQICIGGKKKHDKDVVELKIRFADFRYHKIRTFFNRKRHAKGNVKFSRFLHDAWCLHAKFIAWFSGVPTCAFLKAIRIIWHLKSERQLLFQLYIVWLNAL